MRSSHSLSKSRSPEARSPGNSHRKPMRPLSDGIASSLSANHSLSSSCTFKFIPPNFKRGGAEVSLERSETWSATVDLIEQVDTFPKPRTENPLKEKETMLCHVSQGKNLDPTPSLDNPLNPLDPQPRLTHDEVQIPNVMQPLFFSKNSPLMSNSKEKEQPMGSLFVDSPDARYEPITTSNMNLPGEILIEDVRTPVAIEAEKPEPLPLDQTEVDLPLRTHSPIVGDAGLRDDSSGNGPPQSSHSEPFFFPPKGVLNLNCNGKKELASPHNQTLPRDVTVSASSGPAQEPDVISYGEVGGADSNMVGIGNDLSGSANPDSMEVCVAVRVRPPSDTIDAIQHTNLTSFAEIRLRRLQLLSQTELAAKKWVKLRTKDNAIDCYLPKATGNSGNVGDVSDPSPASSVTPVSFTFEKIFDDKSEQELIMEEIGKKALARVLRGYNGTILCCGQSGCGKTHTMLGPLGGLSLYNVSASVSTLESFGNPRPSKLISASDKNASPRQKNSKNTSYNVSNFLPFGTPVSDLGDLGLLPRMLHQLFETLHAQDLMRKASAAHSPLDEDSSFSSDWSVVISVLEIYNEELRDLLTPVLSGNSASPTRTSVLNPNSSRYSPSTGRNSSVAHSPSNLRIRDAPPGDCVSVYVEGLEECPVHNFQESMRVIQQALRLRNVGTTKLNHTSSRSHTLFFVRLTQLRDATGNNNGTHSSASGSLDSKNTTSSILTLVDLAGSERVSLTGAEGQRLKEAQKINLSLSLLSNVIRLLGKDKVNHIPYRDSKLTRILQDSLGGNAITFLLSHVSPDKRDVAETVSTLRFAKTVKQIKNKPIINKVLSVEELTHQLNSAKVYISFLERKLKEMDRLKRPSFPLGVPSVQSIERSAESDPPATYLDVVSDTEGDSPSLKIWDEEEAQDNTPIPNHNHNNNNNNMEGAKGREMRHGEELLKMKSIELENERKRNEALQAQLEANQNELKKALDMLRIKSGKKIETKFSDLPSNKAVGLTKGNNNKKPRDSQLQVIEPWDKYLDTNLVPNKRAKNLVMRRYITSATIPKQISTPDDNLNNETNQLKTQKKQTPSPPISSAPLNPWSNYFSPFINGVKQAAGILSHSARSDEALDHD